MARLESRTICRIQFRRQHPLGIYTLDFYCLVAKLCIELDGFHHGTPKQQVIDEKRKEFLSSQGIEELRFWNHRWRKNRDGVLLEIWNALQLRTGCEAISRKVQNHRFIPPKSEQLNQSKETQKPVPSPRSEARGEG